MANFWYRNSRLVQLTTGLNWSSADIRALLVMSDSTAGVDKSAQFLTGANGFTTLDEMNGAGYARVTAAGKAVALDVPNDQVLVSFNPLNFGATIANGSRQVAGIVVFLNVGSDATNVPLFWIDSVDAGPIFPYSPAGGQIRAAFANNVALRV